MKKTELLGSARTPDGTLLTLYRHDRDYYIKADGVQLMSTRRHASEDRLAALACEPIIARGVVEPTVLVGGLGLGFTLRAALDRLPANARVVVAEIVAEVIEWNTNPEYEISNDTLSDDRVEIVHDDVARVIAASAGRFDAIILDVDNGAEAITTAQNAGLYRADGVRAAVAALRPAGVVSYWSSDSDPAFERLLRNAGLDVAVTTIRAHATSGPRHWIYVGVK